MSKEVKRWSRHITWEGSQIAATMMALRDDGQFVSWDDYESLLAERDRLAAENERLARDAKNDLIAYRAVIERQAELRAEVDVLKKDAERLDWLMSQDNCVVQEGTSGFWLQWIDEHDPQLSRYQSGEYPSGREAIDAALQGEQP